MRFTHLPLFLSPLFLLASAGSVQQAVASAPAVPVAQEMVNQLNLARTNPAAYADWLETLRPYYADNVLSAPGEDRIRAQVAALDGAIADLRQRQPMAALTVSAGMSQAAQDHVADIGPLGAIGDIGSDNSTVGDRVNRYGTWGSSLTQMSSYGKRTAPVAVALLILNDRLRAEIFNPEFQMLGVACGRHVNQGSMCVLGYAAKYTEQNSQATPPQSSPQPSLQSSSEHSLSLSQSVPQSVSQSVPQLGSQSVSQSGSQLTSPSTSPSTSQPVSQVIPESVSQPVSQVIPESVPQPVSQVIPESVSQVVPQIAAQSAPLAANNLSINLPSTMMAIANTDYFSDLQAADYLSTLEREMIAETNRLRQNPQAYADELESLKQYYEGQYVTLPGMARIETIEGVSAVEEAIAALRRTDRLPPLTPSRGMSLAAADHVKDLGDRGATGHYGSDGSTPIARNSRYGKIPGNSLVGENISFSPLTLAHWHVLQWLIDDGVPNRGHREALLRSEYRKTGIACGSHPVYENMCVMEYASDFVEGY
ncbi:MAG: CAP domain-containing protein [Oculatellaceae cyanobacterium Prado106]|jgi:uncharacterized protein YkwD|nr:CAP domain-containing protein [Oculatellaceae cyanobacterium Prado106]